MRQALFWVGLSITTGAVGCGRSSVDAALADATARGGGDSGGAAGNFSSGSHTGGGTSNAGSVAREDVGGGAGWSENGGRATGQSGRGSDAEAGGRGGSPAQGGQAPGAAGGSNDTAGTNGGGAGGTGSCAEPSVCEPYDNRPNAGLVARITCLSPSSAKANTPLTLDIFGQHLAAAAAMNALVIVGFGGPLNGVPITACHLRVQLPADQIPTAETVSVVVSPGAFIAESAPAWLTVH